MKANEFRVGNWLVYVWENEVGLPVKEYMRIEPIDIWRMEDDEFMELFEPIPLTPEILKKCGFNSDLTITPKWLSDNLAKFSIRVIINKLHITIHKDRDKQFFSFGSIKYLHQLQNLYFALTGEELNINLEEQ